MNPTYRRFDPKSATPAKDGKLSYICEVHESDVLPTVGEKIVIQGTVRTVIEVRDKIPGNSNAVRGMKLIGITA